MSTATYVVKVYECHPLGIANIKTSPFIGRRTETSFFLGDWGSPGSKNFARPPQSIVVPSSTRACSPPTEFFPKISKILPHFSLNFDLFELKTALESFILCLKHTICSNFAVGGIFGCSGQFFQVQPHSTLSLMRVPPSDYVPNGNRKSSSKTSPPTKNFVKTSLQRDKLTRSNLSIRTVSA